MPQTPNQVSIEVFANPAALETKNGKEYIKVPIARKGRWIHPVYGEVVEDQDDFNLITQNWENGVLGYEPPLYLGHPNEINALGGEEAVAFLEHIQQEDDFLFGFYDPIDESAKEKVRAGKYRYASPELARNAINRETGEQVGTVLERHALTNEPFFTKLPRVEVVHLEKFTNNTDSVCFTFTELSTMSEKEDLINQSSQTSSMSTSNPAATQEADPAQTEISTPTTQQFSAPATVAPATTAVAETLLEENQVLRQELADRDRKYADLVEKFTNLETVINNHTAAFQKQATDEKLVRLNKLNISAPTKELYTNKLQAGMSAEAEETMWSLLDELSSSSTQKFTNYGGQQKPSQQVSGAGANPYSSTLEALKKKAVEMGRDFNIPI